tara:strand:- start:222 stop:2258 length:2037 start_codon:yes stop_codon:yes gene_type:complete
MAKAKHNTNDDDFHWLEVDLSDVSYLFRKHLGLLFWAPVFGFVLAVVVAKVQSPMFATEMEIYLRPNFDQEMQIEQSYSKLDDSDSLRSIERVLVSDTMILEMVETLGLRADSAFLGKKFKAGELTDAKLLKTIRDRYTTKLIPTTRVVKLRVEDYSASRTALIAQTLIDEFLSHLREDRNLKGADLRTTLVAQSQKALEGSLSSEKELNKFREANPDTLADQDSSIFKDRILQSGTVLNEANSERSNLAGMIEALEEIEPEKDPFRVFQILSNRNSEYLSELLGMYARAKSELGVAKEQYRDVHPSYKTAESRLTEVESTLRDYAVEMKESVQSEYDAASQKVENLSETLSLLRGEMVGQKSVSAEFRGVKEELDRNWNTYTSLQQKIKDLDLNPEVTPTFATVMSGPVIPDKKAKPRTLFYAAGGVILGCLYALGMIFWRNRCGLPFTSQSQAEDLLALPTVASVQTLAGMEGMAQLTSLEQSPQMLNLLISLRNTRLIHTTSIEQESGAVLLSRAMGRVCARQGSRVLCISIRYQSQHQAGIVDDPILSGFSYLDLPLETLAPANGFQNGIAKLFKSYDRIFVDTSQITGTAVRLEVGRFAEANLLLLQPGEGSSRSDYSHLVEEFKRAKINSTCLVSVEEIKPTREQKSRKPNAVAKRREKWSLFKKRPIPNPA